MNGNPPAGRGQLSTLGLARSYRLRATSPQAPAPRPRACRPCAPHRRPRSEQPRRDRQEGASLTAARKPACSREDPGPPETKFWNCPLRRPNSGMTNAVGIRNGQKRKGEREEEVKHRLLFLLFLRQIFKDRNVSAVRSRARPCA